MCLNASEAVVLLDMNPGLRDDRGLLTDGDLDVLHAVQVLDLAPRSDWFTMFVDRNVHVAAERSLESFSQILPN